MVEMERSFVTAGMLTVAAPTGHITHGSWPAYEPKHHATSGASWGPQVVAPSKPPAACRRAALINQTQSFAGLAASSRWLPLQLLSVPLGAVADRRDPRRLMQIGMTMFIAAWLD